MKIVATGRGGWDLPAASLEWQFEQARDGRGMLVFDHGWHQLAVAHVAVRADPARVRLARHAPRSCPASRWTHRRPSCGSTTTACGRCSTSRSRSTPTSAPATTPATSASRSPARRGYVRTNRISAQGVQEPAVVLYRDGETRAFHDLDDRPPDAFRASTAHALAFYRGEVAEPVMGARCGPPRARRAGRGARLPHGWSRRRRRRRLTRSASEDARARRERGLEPPPPADHRPVGVLLHPVGREPEVGDALQHRLHELVEFDARQV